MDERRVQVATKIFERLVRDQGTPLWEQSLALADAILPLLEVPNPMRTIKIDWQPSDKVVLAAADWNHFLAARAEWVEGAS